MADLTQGSIAGLLGMLKSAMEDEARLMGGVHSDMKFIKDEMDSMNGFLLHLTKMECEHDDQVRAWMKQVREVSYVAGDCVDRYVRRIGRSGLRLGDDRCWGWVGCLTMARLFVLDHKAYLQIRELGKQIAELKARVHAVGERRLRYGVSVPDGRRDLRRVDDSSKLPGQQELERREAFVLQLEEEEKKKARTGTLMLGGLLQDALAVAVPSAAVALGLGGAASDIVGQLPALLVPSEAATIRGILKKCSADEADEGEAFRCTKKMFLCALYVYPYPTSQELKKLKEEVDAPGVAAKEARYKVMVFCYSLLSTQQKTCLQYLTAFLYEKEISRTSMVRRWVAEGLVGKDLPREGGGGGGSAISPEEAGERCFRELLLRGFIRPARRSDAGTVKSCVMDAPACEFIQGITKSENFVADLPDHLGRQLEIRRIVNRRAPSTSMPPPRPQKTLLRRHCCLGDHGALEVEDDTTMDELVVFLDKLPQLYRLNVLDLGGCKGLESRHIESFCDVDCLKYLSLRNTDVSGLNAKHINKLKELETLDIRGTDIPPRDTKKINLPKLKHLLAGHFTTTTTMPSGSADAAANGTTTTTTLTTVHMPDKIVSMGKMETLSHVQVSSDGDGAERQLRGVARLQQLRKLGLVVHANTTIRLGQVLSMLAGNLRSFSVWLAIAVPHTTTTTTIQQGGDILDISAVHDDIASNLVLENLDIKGKMMMSLPPWISRAKQLANVTLRDTEMDGRDALRRLSALQSLRCLKLSRKAFTEQVIRFKDDVKFQALKSLVIEGDAITQVAFFADDAAPKLERIVWAIGEGSRIAQMYNEDLIVGIDHLPSLNVIEVRASFNKEKTNPSEWTTQQQRTTSSARTTNPRYYCIRYISLSSNEIIGEVPRTAAHHTTFSLRAGIIN